MANMFIPEGGEEGQAIDTGAAAFRSDVRPSTVSGDEGLIDRSRLIGGRPDESSGPDAPLRAPPQRPLANRLNLRGRPTTVSGNENLIDPRQTLGGRPEESSGPDAPLRTPSYVYADRLDLRNIPTTVSAEEGLIHPAQLLGPSPTRRREPHYPPSPPEEAPPSGARRQARQPASPESPSAPSSAGEVFRAPDDRYDPTGQREAVGVLYGPGNRPIPPEPGTAPRPKLARDETDPEGHLDAPLRTGGATLPERGESDPEGHLDAPLRTGGATLPARGAGTPPGNRPGAGGGAAGAGGAGGGGGRRKALGDPTRREAYDPTLDRADPRNVAPVDESYRANPKLWEQAQKGAIDPTKPGVRTGEQAARYTNNYTSALAGATEYMREMFHQKPGDPNQGEGYAALTFKGVGAPDPKIVEGVFSVVDPKNELQPKEKMELATRAMHDWYMARGDKKSADKVAAEILQYGNTQAKALGNQAMQAMKAGNREAAAQAIQQAYGWLPDGFDATVQNNTLTVTNDQGKVVRTLPLDDKSITNLSVGLATGTLYWDLVQERAGVAQKFGPPVQAPTQAIAAQPPQPGTPPAATAPGGASSPPFSAPPGSPPPPVTPPSNRPAAPASAAPGPAPTPQAAPPSAPTTPAPASAPAPAPAITPEPPARLTPAPTPPQGDGGPPGSPASEIPQGDGGPPGSPASEIPQGDGGPPGSPAGKPPTQEERYTYKNDDRDSVPVDKKTGKAAQYRRRSISVTPEVQQAQKNIAAINEWYQQEIKNRIEDASTPGLNLKDKEVNEAFAAQKKYIDAQYKAQLKEQEDVIKAYRAEQKEADQREIKALEVRRSTGMDRTQEITDINEQLKSMTDKKDKWELYKTNPLRLERYNDEKKWVPIRNTILEVQAHNRHLSFDEVTRLVVSAISHLENGPNDPKQTLNGKVGEHGARYRVLGLDLNSNIVIQVGGGTSAKDLHMPPETFADIVKFRTQSYGEKKAEFDKATKKHEQAVEEHAIRTEAYSPGDPHGRRKKFIDKWFGPGEKPPVRP